MNKILTTEKRKKKGENTINKLYHNLQQYNHTNVFIYSMFLNILLFIILGVVLGVYK